MASVPVVWSKMTLLPLLFKVHLPEENDWLGWIVPHRDASCRSLLTMKGLTLIGLEALCVFRDAFF